MLLVAIIQSAMPKEDKTRQDETDCPQLRSLSATSGNWSLHRGETLLHIDVRGSCGFLHIGVWSVSKEPKPFSPSEATFIATPSGMRRSPSAGCVPRALDGRGRTRLAPTPTPAWLVATRRIGPANRFRRCSGRYQACALPRVARPRSHSAHPMWLGRIQLRSESLD
jgi:hypothetical protein